MNQKIYGNSFNLLALVAAIWLYPQTPILSSIAIALFLLAFALQGVALIIKWRKDRRSA